MNKAAENGFIDLSVKLPCCGSDSSLNDLLYDFPCGFSSAEFVITNPVTELNGRMTSALQELLGVTVRVIHTHL